MMTKVGAGEVKVAERRYGIRQSIDVAVRAGVALGAAVLVCSAPLAAHAAVPDRLAIDAGAFGVYVGTGRVDVAEPRANAAAAAVANPNFGAQSEYEAYIASITPPGREVVNSYAAPVMIDKSERQFLNVGANGFLSVEKSAGAVANIAPSSAATFNRFSEPGSFSAAPAITVVDASVYAEGYDWYVDPVKLRSAVVPASGRAVGDGAITPVKIVGNSLVAPPSSGANRYNWDADPELLLQPKPLEISSDGWPAEAATVGDVNLANIAPSSAAADNAYSAGNAALLNELDRLRSQPVIRVEIGSPSSAAATLGYSEGYDWYVDPVKLRAATVPGASSASSNGYAPQNSYAPYVHSILPNDPLLEASLPREKAAPVITAVDASVYAEGYDWYVSPGGVSHFEIVTTNKPVGAGEIPPVVLGVKNEARIPAVSSSGVDRYNWSADPELLLSPPALTATTGGNSNSTESRQNAVVRSMSPQAQVQSLFENGHISREVFEAEIATYSIAVAPAPQAVQSESSLEEQLQSLFANGNLPRRVLEEELALYQNRAFPAMAVRPPLSAEVQLRNLYENGHVTHEVVVAAAAARAMAVAPAGESGAGLDAHEAALSNSGPRIVDGDYAIVDPQGHAREYN